MPLPPPILPLLDTLVPCPPCCRSLACEVKRSRGRQAPGWPANLQTVTRGAPGCIPGFLRSSRVSVHQASTGEPRMLKEVGGVTVQARHRATCHCGAVELELDLPDGIVDPRRCDCSICRRKIGRAHV